MKSQREEGRLLDWPAASKVFWRMDFASRWTTVILICVLSFGLNVIFGYFRGKQKKFSFKWFLYIHLPIPFVAFARIFSHLDWRYIPIFLAAAIIGQIFGARMGA
jgi:hypothetical protein